MTTAFIQIGFAGIWRCGRTNPRMCDAQPKRPRDPTDLRSESEKRRNQPPKPMRRRVRKREVDDPIDWDSLPSVPLVRSDAPPESGEDYWMDINEAATVDEVKNAKPSAEKSPIDENLRNRLKEEVVSPYTQNWILRIAIVVFILAVLVSTFGGSDTTPIISLPDL